MFIASFSSCANSFQRLEDFPSYTSCIKCFGRSIIPPLLTEKQRNEISLLREAALRKENDVLKMKKDHLFFPTKVRNSSYNVQESCTFSRSNKEFIPLSEMSALCLNMGDLLSPSTDSASIINEMYVSMSKFPSNGICSTMHQGVIVCPNVINTKKKPNRMKNVLQSSGVLKASTKHFKNDMNSECRICQVACHQDLLSEFGVPYDNFTMEHVNSVSEDEHASATEEIEFGSLPTVISATKLNVHDTDNESNITFLTESTDLERYMDCVYEFSSPDDAAIIANSQISNQHTMSSRSDDASSETLVNTESELTPCASAMAELNAYSNSTPSGIADSHRNLSLGDHALLPNNREDRAHSVDSYMDILKTGSSKSENLSMKKSQSEPSHANATMSSAPVKDFLLPQNMEHIELTTNNRGDASSEIKHSLLSPISDVEVIHISGKESNIGKCDTHKKTHVRNSSYTLDHPSSALIMAHASCNCMSDDADNASPHSCSSGRKSETPPTLAFRKEKMNSVHPSISTKLYPILSPLSPSTSAQIIDPKMSKVLSSMSSVSCCETIGYCGEEIDTSSAVGKESSSVTAESKANQISIEHINLGLGESINESFEFAENPQGTSNSEPTKSEERKESQQSIVIPEENERNASTHNACEEKVNQTVLGTITCSMDQNNKKRNDIQFVLNKIFQDVQENQKIRVNQLLEEQNRQWLQLQEEFKEQERLLCAKLNLVNMTSFKEHSPENISQPCSSDLISKCRTEHINNKHDVLPIVNNANLSDTFTNESLGTPETDPSCQSKSNLSEFSSESVSSQEFKTYRASHSKTNCTVSVSNVNCDTKLHPKNISLNRPEGTQPSISVESAVSVDTSSEVCDYGIQTKNLPMSVGNVNDYLDTGHGDIVISEKTESTQSSHSILSAISSDGKSPIPNASEYNKSIESHLFCQPCASTDSLAPDILSDNLQYKNCNENNSILLESPTATPCPLHYLSLSISGNSPNISNYINSFLPKYEETYRENIDAYLQFANVNENSFDVTSPVDHCCCFGIHQSDGDVDISNYETCPDCNYPTSSQKDDKRSSSSTVLCKDTVMFKNPNEGERPTSELSFKSMNGYITKDSYGSESFSVCNHVEESTDPAHNSPMSPQDQNHEMHNKNVKCNKLQIHSINKDNKANSLKDNSHKQDVLLLKPANMVGKFSVSSSNKASKYSSYSETKNAYDFENRADCNSGQNYCDSHEITSKPLNVSHSVKKNRKDSRIVPKPNKTTRSLCSEAETGTPKHIMSPSLTNLKRIQSKDVLDIMKDPILQKKLERLPAYVKGYLTRRLFKTEKVQGLLKTLKDTYLLLGKLSEEQAVRREPVSEHDADFQRQLIVQLMDTFQNMYDIFCTISIKEQMKIISESRNFRLKQKAIESAKVSSDPVITEKPTTPLPPKKPKISSATLKSLERKKRSSSIDNRTYTIEDFKGCRPRVCSSISPLKSRVASPSRIYKSTVGLNVKRKTTSVLKTQHWK